MQAGTSALAWEPHGHRLVIAEAGSDAQVTGALQDACILRICLTHFAEPSAHGHCWQHWHGLLCSCCGASSPLLSAGTGAQDVLGSSLGRLTLQVVELSLCHTLAHAHRIVAMQDAVPQQGPTPEVHLLLVQSRLCHGPGQLSFMCHTSGCASLDTSQDASGALLHLLNVQLPRLSACAGR